MRTLEASVRVKVGRRVLVCRGWAQAVELAFVLSLTDNERIARLVQLGIERVLRVANGRGQ